MLIKPLHNLSYEGLTTIWHIYPLHFMVLYISHKLTTEVPKRFSSRRLCCTQSTVQPAALMQWELPTNCRRIISLT